jgi:coenzyme F420-reducing hydrogenase delta subunit
MSRVDMIHELMDDFGFDRERLMLTWCSSAEPDKFVEAVTKMTTVARKLGPLNENSEATQAA